MKRNILAIIPARGGSKGIPRKNIKPFIGKPLIGWTIEQAKQSKFITRTILSSDCDEIIEIAKTFGCEVPFKRPAKIAGDLSTDFEFMEHSLKWLVQHEPDYHIDAVVHLRPTYPLRNPAIVDECIEKFLQNTDEYDCLRTVIENDRPAFKMYTIKNDKLQPLFEEIDGIQKPYNKARQLLPATYWHNGYVDIVKPSTILEKRSMTGDKILPFILDSSEIYDIDTEEEWQKAELSARRSK